MDSMKLQCHSTVVSFHSTQAKVLSTKGIRIGFGQQLERRVQPRLEERKTGYCKTLLSKGVQPIGILADEMGCNARRKPQR